jgi:hypothetical protein
MAMFNASGSTQFNICLNNSHIASNKNCKKKENNKKKWKNSCVQHLIPKVKEQNI